MQESIKWLKIFTFEDYWVSYDEEEHHQIFDDGYCYGIKFKREGTTYELVHNRVGLTRILITAGEGNFKDIPFHAGTIGLMPPGIIFRKIPEGFRK